jgi:hypothetical protein
VPLPISKAAVVTLNPPRPVAPVQNVVLGTVNNTLRPSGATSDIITVQVESFGKWEKSDLAKNHIELLDAGCPADVILEPTRSHLGQKRVLSDVRAIASRP